MVEKLLCRVLEDAAIASIMIYEIHIYFGISFVVTFLKFSSIKKSCCKYVFLSYKLKLPTQSVSNHFPFYE